MRPARTTTRTTMPMDIMITVTTTRTVTTTAATGTDASGPVDEPFQSFSRPQTPAQTLAFCQRDTRSSDSTSRKSDRRFDLAIV